MEEIPTRLTNELTFGEVHRNFAASQYGDKLATEVRFDRYRPESVSKEDWREYLGADVDNLEHMPVTYGIARAFLKYQALEASSGADEHFNKDEQIVLLLSAQINDWHEALVGDINYELKTDQDEQDELAGFHEIFDEFFDMQDPKNHNLKLAVERTLFDKNSKLGMAFNAIERIGYLRTGLRAYEVSREIEDEQLKGHLEWLAAGVLSNQIPPLVEYESTYAMVSRYLEERSTIISEAFVDLSAEIFPRHGQTEKQKQELYEYSENRWAAYNEQDSIGTISREAYDRGVFGQGPNFEKRFLPDYEELSRQIEACRTLGMKIVLTSGSFDLKHVGHERYLYHAHKRGDVLVVGVDSDEKIRQRKGEHRPLNPEEERLESLVHLRYVDFVTLKHSVDPKWHLIKTVRPDTLILTQETYDKEDIEALREYCGDIVMLPPQATTSTSAKLGQFLKDHEQQISGELESAIEGWVEEGVVDEHTAQRLGRQLIQIYKRLIK